MPSSWGIRGDVAQRSDRVGFAGLKTAAGEAEGGASQSRYGDPVGLAKRLTSTTTQSSIHSSTGSPCYCNHAASSPGVRHQAPVGVADG
jgi:hypothetical protein